VRVDACGGAESRSSSAAVCSAVVTRSAAPAVGSALSFSGAWAGLTSAIAVGGLCFLALTSGLASGLSAPKRVSGAADSDADGELRPWAWLRFFSPFVAVAVASGLPVAAAITFAPRPTPPRR
jgi:hypothetical protein